MKLYGDLLERNPGQLDAVVAKARIWNDLGALFAANLRPLPDVIALHRQAVDFLSSQSQTLLQKREIQYELARAHDLAGSAGIRGMMNMALTNSPGGFPFGPGGSPPRGPGGERRPPAPFGPPPGICGEIPSANLPADGVARADLPSGPRRN